MFTNVFTFSEGVMSERYQNKMMNEIKALLKYKRKYLRQIRKKNSENLYCRRGYLEKTFLTQV